MKHYKYIARYNTTAWVKMRHVVFNEMSEQQTLFCVCGKLATGLHEDHCVKFNRLVDKETARRLDAADKKINRRLFSTG